jgi:5-methylthioadenosine/S-adenosylhomocysteine deaminase
MARREELLEEHTLVVRDGRILEVLPNAACERAYASRIVLDLPHHVLMPGLVNARTAIGGSCGDAGGARFEPRAGLIGIANMLKAGITCFCDVGYFPREVAQLAAAQGMRALIGLPVAEHASAWAPNAAECLTRDLSLRDEYKGHPGIATAFAPLDSTALSDATFARLRTLADELDAGVLIGLGESQRDIDASLQRHGVRPLERLGRLGLLTPALTAAHMVHLDDRDLALAAQSGMAVTLCLASDLERGEGWAPIAALGAAGLRLSLGTEGAVCGNAHDLWTEIKLLSLLSPYAPSPRARSPSALGADRDQAAGMSAAAGVSAAAGAGAAVGLRPWDTLAAATRGGAAALGLDTEIGTLEAGKWADLCSVDLSGPSTQPILDPLRHVVHTGGRDLVSDVWVAGRQLLCKGRFTRLDLRDNEP